MSWPRNVPPDARRVGDPSGDADAVEGQNLPDGNNYEILSLVGEGGMARVFKARDRNLDRLVALKVLRPDVPVSQPRFFREARAQARVVHDHVCRLYEVGRSAQGPFIAMQLVDGKPLAAVARELDLRDRLLVFCDVADAVEAAHRTGLLHRDLKPANVLVERRDGGWHAYVTDFGLARDLLKPGSTLEGTLIGSPLYMAPEQADARATLDPRTDVYGLGATLYELLVGRPPFLGASSLQILYRTLHEDPVPPRKLDPALAPGLERIVLQCLEKAPGRRYPGAEALAEDLRRHLRGERVHARRQGAIGRFRRVIARNPALSSLSILALALAAALVAFGVLAARRERAVAQAARSFGERVRAAESTVRLGSLLPLHDLGREKEQARRQLAAIEKEMTSVRPEVAALGDAALGRGYLGLRDYQRAREHLELAVRSGRASPQDRYALGLALGELYARELDRAQTLGGNKGREARAKELESALRAPALVNLRAAAASGGEQQAPEYVEALIARYEGRYDDALAKARAAFARSPSLYEAKKLEGDVLAARALDAARQGDRERSAADFQAAGAAYATATGIARSDPAVHVADCQRSLGLLKAGGWAGTDPRPVADAGISACGRALEADPESRDARTIVAMIHYSVAEWDMSHGENPTGDVREMLDVSQSMLKHDPRDVDGWRISARAWFMLGWYEFVHGPDPRPSFERQISAMEQALAIEPRYSENLNMLGAGHRFIAIWEVTHGIDPTPQLDEAAAALHRAIEVDDGNVTARKNLGESEITRAGWLFDKGSDPSAVLDGVERLAREMVERFPAYPYLAVTVCPAATLRGLHLTRQGSTPEAAFEAGFARCKATIRPGAPAEVLASAAETAVEWAKALAAQGRDPAPALREADPLLADALRLDPRSPEALRLRAEAALARARWAVHEGRDPAPLFAAGERDANRAIAISPSFDFPYRSLARIDAARLEWRRRAPALAAAEARRGIRDVRRALEVRPGWPELLALEALFKRVR
ncbi:MAG TPA: serine/threonine-protein kinase [Myxococcales bacterium]